METVPKEFEEGEIIMSNFDHEIEDGAEDNLKSNKISGGYAGWNFYGTVWFDGKFKCQIKQYRQHVTTICGDSLREIMEKVSQQFGEA